MKTSITLPNKVELEIELIETKRSIDASLLYHIWVEAPITRNLLEKIINNGISLLSKEELTKLAAEQEGGVYRED